MAALGIDLLLVLGGMGTWRHRGRAQGRRSRPSDAAPRPSDVPHWTHVQIKRS